MLLIGQYAYSAFKWASEVNVRTEEHATTSKRLGILGLPPDIGVGSARAATWKVVSC
jgi:hypothetical protein